MGTRGIWGYRHKGQYYIIYTQWDSYPEELGKKLVTDVPSDPDEFKGEFSLELKLQFDY